MKPEIVSTQLSSRDIALGALGKLFVSKAVSSSLPERSLLSQDIPLQADAIRAYAGVCGFKAEHGIPMTWPHVLSFPLQMRFMLSRDFPFSVIGLVHFANIIRQHEVLTFDQSLSIRVSGGQYYSHDKGQLFTIETSVFCDERLLWEATSVYLKLGVGSPFGEIYDFSSSEEKLLINKEVIQVPLNTGKRYAAVSGDQNPIHTSWFAARAFGFRRTIAHGMWSKARVLASLLPLRPVSQTEVAVMFKAPLLMPNSVFLLSSASGKDLDFVMRDPSNDKPYLQGHLKSF